MELKELSGLAKCTDFEGDERFKVNRQLFAGTRKCDNEAVKKALADLKKACQDENENLMPHILAAVKTYATLGEICNVMREVFGEYVAHVSL